MFKSSRVCFLFATPLLQFLILQECIRKIHFAMQIPFIHNDGERPVTFRGNYSHVSAINCVTLLGEWVGEGQWGWFATLANILILELWWAIWRFIQTVKVNRLISCHSSDLHAYHPIRWSGTFRPHNPSVVGPAPWPDDSFVAAATPQDMSSSSKRIPWLDWLYLLVSRPPGLVRTWLMDRSSRSPSSSSSSSSGVDDQSILHTFPVALVSAGADTLNYGDLVHSSYLATDAVVAIVLLSVPLEEWICRLSSYPPPKRRSGGQIHSPDGPH